MGSARAIHRLFFILVFAVPTNTSAQEDSNFYIQLDGGTAAFADSELNGRDVTFSDGWSANARMGLDKEGLAVELDVGLHGAPFEPVGRNYSPALFLTVGGNVLFNIIRAPFLDWYVGIGGGYIGFDMNSTFGQIEGRAETGLIVRATKHVQLVPHYRVTAIYQMTNGGGYPDSQYISTARLGIRFANLNVD